MKEDISRLRDQLSSSKEIVIVTHRNPDGDAMGSSLALWNFLAKRGNAATVITPNDYPDFLAWLPGNGKVLKYDTDTIAASEKILKAGIIFCLDFNNLSRLEGLGSAILASKAWKVLVDHHPQPEPFADFAYHDTDSCSTAQLIFELISELGEKHLLDKDSAICLYTGIMTDTASFRFPSVQAKTHRIAAELIDLGMPHYLAHEQVYDTNTEERLKLLGFTLLEKMQVLREYNAACISLSESELKRYKFRKGDTEGLVNYPLSIKGMRLSAFFMERDGVIKVSLRSKGDFDVNKMARAHFNGGGHRNAAGGDLKLTLDEAVKKFLELLPGYRNELQK